MFEYEFLFEIFMMVLSKWVDIGSIWIRSAFVNSISHDAQFFLFFYFQNNTFLQNKSTNRDKGKMTCSISTNS